MGMKNRIRGVTSSRTRVCYSESSSISLQQVIVLKCLLFTEILQIMGDVCIVSIVRIPFFICIGNVNVSHHCNQLRRRLPLLESIVYPISNQELRS
jgi:hypothetical protein